jgi:bacteriocin-like protein
MTIQPQNLKSAPQKENSITKERDITKKQDELQEDELNKVTGGAGTEGPTEDIPFVYDRSLQH